MPMPPAPITAAIDSFYKTTLSGGVIPASGAVTCRHYPSGSVLPKGAPPPKSWAAGVRRIWGGNEDDTPAIRVMSDSRVLRVGLSTEGWVMAALRPEVS